MSKLTAYLVGLILLAAAGGCGGDDEKPADAPTPSTSAPAATATTGAAFDPQAYCVGKLRPLQAKYPKSLGGADLAAECTKMIGQTKASAPETIDALLEAAESYYKAFG